MNAAATISARPRVRVSPRLPVSLSPCLPVSLSSVPLARCPDCGVVSTLGELLATNPLPGFAQCPHCMIGSPAGEWRVP